MGPLVINGLTWLIGHLASKGTDISAANIEYTLRSMDLLNLLDDYNKDVFSNHLELSDAQKECITGKKKELVRLAKECLSDVNYSGSESTRKRFIGDACELVSISSEGVKAYFDQIYTLVLINTTDNIPKDYIALINAYADEQRERIQEHDLRITNLEKAGYEVSGSVDFGPYYEQVKERFTRKGRSEYKALIGDESNEDAYIDAFINDKSGSIPVLFYLEDWFSDTEDRAILIYGEPGHGKSLLCDKAVFEFNKGNFLKGKAKNVLAVSLNTGENPSIIINNEVKLANALVWGAENENRFSFEDCRGSLLFLDGFDEFVDAAKQTNINNICTFMKRVKKIAYENDMHIVVLSREIAVSKSLKDLSGICSHYKLLPISKRQQDKWLNRHKEYEEYKETFYKLRNNKNMASLFGVPLLFRLIIHSRFDIVSSNVVDLYDNLFIHLMRKRGIWGDARLEIENALMDLAFDIYCTDTDMAFLEEKDWDSCWIFAFYVKALSGRKVGFFHRTFYQYFLAKYIHREILKVTDEKTAEGLIGSLAERELDDTVRDYLGKVDIKEDESYVHAGIEGMIIALANREAHLNPEPRIESGDAEKSRILRSTNIYRNTLHIAAAFRYGIRIPFNGKLDIMLRTFDSSFIIFKRDDDKRVDMKGVNLEGANLDGTTLEGADLEGADLKRVSLERANLKEATLEGANLKGANLKGADLEGADLEGTNLERADLEGAYLKEANLEEAHLERANLERANLKEADLKEACLERASLFGAHLKEAHLERANLLGVNLKAAHLEGAHLEGVNMYAANLECANMERTNLVRADLGYAFMEGAHLKEAHLEGTNLSGARLSGANLSGAHLNGADMRRTRLEEACLERADLFGANLKGAQLERARLEGADLTKAIINIKYKNTIDQSTKGYDSIIWVTDDNEN